MKRYEQHLIMAEGMPRVTDEVKGDSVCAGCCMRRMRVVYFPLDTCIISSSVRGAGLGAHGRNGSNANQDATYVVAFIDDYPRRICVYFMKAKAGVLSKLKI